MQNFMNKLRLLKNVRTVVPVIAIVIPVLFFVSCDDQATGPGNSAEPPTLPNSGIFSPSMNTFNQSPSSEAGESTAAEEYENFSYAAVKASAYGAVLTGNTAIPAALLASATSTNPEQTGNGWQWNYGTSYNQSTFEATLNAEVDLANREADWELTASANWAGFSFEDRTFLTGSSSLNGQNGHWYTYRPVNSSEMDTTGRTEYAYTDSTQYNVGMRILTTQDYEGDSLYFERNASQKTMKYFDATQQDSVIINWNTESGNGSILDPSYNGSQKACWDSTLTNAGCPSAN